jgi:hypothetical protein
MDIDRNDSQYDSTHSDHKVEPFHCIRTIYSGSASTNARSSAYVYPYATGSNTNAFANTKSNTYTMLRSCIRYCMFIRRGISGAEEKEEVVKAKAKYKFLLVKLTFFVKERLLVKVFTEGKKSY